MCSGVPKLNLDGSGTRCCENEPVYVGIAAILTGDRLKTSFWVILISLRRRRNNRYAVDRNLSHSLNSLSGFSHRHVFKRESQFYEMLPLIVYEGNSFVEVRNAIQRHLRFGNAIRALGNRYVVHGFMETVVHFEF